MVLCRAAPLPTAGTTSAVTLGSISGTGIFAVSWDAPVLTSASPFNLPAAATPTGIALGGLLLLAEDGGAEATATAALGGSRCATTSWTSATSALCSARLAGSGGGVDAAVTVGGVVGSAAALLTFDAPPVTLASPSNSAATGGVFVALAAFAVHAATPTAALGAAACATTSWTSATMVECLAAAYTR